MTPADDDDLDGDAQFQGVRDLFRYAREHGFDEDPSPRIDAILMAAARHHAPEQVGSFERVRRWLVVSLMRPAVLGATMVAIVGASAGVLYLRSGGVAEPTMGRKQASTPVVTPRMPEHPALEDLPLHGAAVGSGSGSVMMSSETSDEIAARLRAIQEKENQHTADDPRPRPRGGGGGGAGGGSGNAVDGFAGGNEDRGGGSGSGSGGSGEGGTLDYRPDGRDTATVVTTGPGGGKGGGGTGAGGVVTHFETTGQEEPPPPPPDVGTGGSGGGDDETVAIAGTTGTADKIDRAESEKAKKAAANRAQAENLLRQARTAAKKKNCPTVKVMAKRAKQLDAAYYKDTFTRDAAVKNCL